MERFSSSGLFYAIAKTSWNYCSGVCSSHQTLKEIPNWVYDFFLISVYKVNIGACFNTERRTSLLLLTNLDFDVCMNLYSKELPTRIASGLIICCERWERFAVGCSSAVEFWANTRFLLLGQCVCCTFCIVLVIIDIPIFPLLPPWLLGRIICLGFTALFGVWWLLQQRWMGGEALLCSSAWKLPQG